MSRAVGAGHDPIVGPGLAARARRVRRRPRRLGAVAARPRRPVVPHPAPERHRGEPRRRLVDARQGHRCSPAPRRSAASSSASCSGPSCGLATARWATAREVLLPVAIGASTIPIIAFAPITLNWFGPESLLPRVTIVAVMVFFPVMVNTVRGLTNVEPAALELLSSYAASDTQILRQAAGPECAAVLVHGAADRDDAERHRRGRRGVLRRAAVRARDLHHARDRAQPISDRRGRPSCSPARSGSCSTSIAVALERLVIPWYSAREMAR